MDQRDERPETFSTSSSRGGKVSDLNRLPDVLTVEQVSMYLQVSRSVVYGEISTGRLPAVRLGVRVIRVSKWALQRWLERTDGRTAAESEALSRSASLGRRH
jgi:excisionase family DNA binding protein